MALRILHIGKFFPPYQGGMESFLHDLIHEQHVQGIEAYALVHGEPRLDDPAWLTRISVQFKLSYAPIALGFRNALARAIAKLQPDVLHLHMPNNSALWLLTLPEASRIPWVIHWQSDVISSNFSIAVKLGYFIYKPFEQALLERCRKVIVTSPPYLQTSKALKSWHHKCVVIPLGIATFKPDSTTVADESSQWHPHSRIKLLSIGRLTYYKGFETLIKAVSPMNDVGLLIVGDGELRPALERLIRELTPQGESPNVRLVGSVHEQRKRALLQACDVFCLASKERTEAFGVVLLEAMQHAKPCLVSDLAGSGMPWIVTTAACGLTIPTGNKEAWQSTITRLKQRPEQLQIFAEAGPKAMDQRFSIEKCVQHLTYQYLNILPEQPRASRQTSDVLFVIPAKNESASIGMVLRDLKADGWTNLLVIDDHSTDDTGAIARQEGAIVLRPPLPLGAWGGMQAGIRYAQRNNFHAVITMDADGQHEASEIPALLGSMMHADVVIGAFPERASKLRKIAWHWFRRLAGFELRDLTSGFRLYNQEAIGVLATDEATLLDYQDLGALLLIRRAGLSITEVPVSMNLRANGKSRIFHSWWSVLKYMAATTVLCLASWETKSRRFAKP